MILISALWLSGCHKTKLTDEPVALPITDNPNQPPQNHAVGGQTAAELPLAANPGNGGADLRQLNHAYLRWIVQNRRRPTSYENFLALSGLQVPPAPSGKKYVIDKNGFIALADVP